MHVLVYVRVSTDRQTAKELSLPAQLAACRQHAIQREWLFEEFIESGASARTADRPALKRLLQRCRESTPHISAVVVHKLDRLARNLGDHVAIKSALAKTRTALVSVAENVDDSVSGRLVEHIMAAIAEFYSANLSEEVKKGCARRSSRGSGRTCYLAAIEPSNVDQHRKSSSRTTPLSWSVAHSKYAQTATKAFWICAVSWRPWD